MSVVTTAWGYYLHAFQWSLVWTGRATRAEYWFFMAVHVVATALMMGLDRVADTEMRIPLVGTIGVFSGIYALITLVVYSSLTVRRLHDIDRSAWLLLWGLVPFAGNIVLLVYNALPSIGHANRYGYNPHDRVTLGGSL